MLKWLLATMIAATPDPVCAPTQPVAEGERAITTIRCAGRDGFFVPSALYRELRDIELREPAQLRLISGLELKITGLTASSSIANQRADFWHRSYDTLYAARNTDRDHANRMWAKALEAQPSPDRSFVIENILWFLGGAVIVGGAVLLDRH